MAGGGRERVTFLEMVAAEFVIVVAVFTVAYGVSLGLGWILRHIFR